ncbi:MAG: uracil phosphoribosyltransferase [Actinomycetota bacterium]
MHVDVLNHPVVAAQLTELRNASTDRRRFRQLLHQVARALVFEAARSIPTTEVTVDSPMGPADGVELVDQPVLIPILRAGLGMLDAGLEALPGSETGFLGLRRNEETLRPEVYMNTIPVLNERPTFVLDPMLATGGSAAYAAEQVRRAGAGSVTLIALLAAPEGIDALRTDGVYDRVVTAAIDSHLNEVGFIVPGLGDAGDRQYGVD